MKIVVAVDGSTYSSFALQALAHFAPPEECTLVHALALPDLNYPLITPEVREEAQRDITARLREKGEEYLNKAEDQLPSHISHVQRIHQIGHPVEVILETIRSSRADLVLLGARGLGQVKELILGSVSHRVVLHAPCSTLVVTSQMKQLHKILLPVEGEEDAQAALNFLALKPFNQPVEVEVFSVWPQPQLPWPTTVGHSKLLETQAIVEAQNKLDRISDRLKKMNYPCRSEVGLGNPALAILEQAKASKPDLIMMGTHSRGGFARFLMGSVSHSILHQSSLPVLIVR